MRLSYPPSRGSRLSGFPKADRIATRIGAGRQDAGATGHDPRRNICVDRPVR